MRKCINCEEEIKDGEDCYELPPDMSESGFVVFKGQERLFCEWCGGNIKLSRNKGGEIINIYDISDAIDSGPSVDDILGEMGK